MKLSLLIDKLQVLLIDRLTEPIAHWVQKRTGIDSIQLTKGFLWLVIVSNLSVMTIYRNAGLNTEVLEKISFPLNLGCALVAIGLSGVLLLLFPMLETWMRRNLLVSAKNPIYTLKTYRICLLLAVGQGLVALGWMLILFLKPNWLVFFKVLGDIAFVIAICLVACTPLPPKPDWLVVPESQSA